MYTAMVQRLSAGEQVHRCCGRRATSARICDSPFFQLADTSTVFCRRPRPQGRQSCPDLARSHPPRRDGYTLRRRAVARGGCESGRAGRRPADNARSRFGGAARGVDGRVYWFVRVAVPAGLLEAGCSRGSACIVRAGACGSILRSRDPACYSPAPVGGGSGCGWSAPHCTRCIWDYMSRPCWRMASQAISSTSNPGSDSAVCDSCSPRWFGTAGWLLHPTG